MHTHTMQSQRTITLTLTENELQSLRTATFDASTHWYKHLRNSQEDPNYFLPTDGCKLVYEQRMRMYEILTDLAAIYLPDTDTDEL